MVLRGCRGRAASLRNLVALFGGDDCAEEAGWQLRPMFALHCARAVWTWTAMCCFVGSILLGTAMQHQQRAARAAFFYVFGIVLSLVFGVMLNWFFGLAPLFCIREQMSARDAVSVTLDFCRAKLGGSSDFRSAFSPSVGLGGSMFLLLLAPTSLGKHVRWDGCFAYVLFSSIYFAGADALYLARLGAYAALAEIDARSQCRNRRPSQHPSQHRQSFRFRKRPTFSSRRRQWWHRYAAPLSFKGTAG